MSVPLKRIPKAVWSIVIVFFFIPLVYEIFLVSPYDQVWSLHVLSIALVIYYTGVRGGIIAFILSTITHIGWEWYVYMEGALNNKWIILDTTIINLLLTLGLGFYLGKLRQKGHVLDSFFESDDILVWVSHSKKKGQTVSKGFANVFGVSKATFENDPSYWKKAIHPEDKHMIDPISQAIKSGQQDKFECRIIHTSGDIRWIENIIVPELYRGPFKNVGVINDITDKKQAELEVKRLAYYDPLTGLPNRNAVDQIVGGALNEKENANGSIGLLLLNLDNFKKVNESFGHHTGGVLLKCVVARIKTLIDKETEFLRFGGDEFILVIKGANEERLKAFAQQLMDSFTAPFMVNDYIIYTSLSIGISMNTDGQLNEETIIKHANAAMNLAKTAGKNTYQFYSLALERKLIRKIEIEKGLYQAINKQELFLVYHPKFDLYSQHLMGVEALIRWKHPTLGMIPPDEFIPVAEDTGIIEPIGTWVIHEACQQSARWQRQGAPPIPISINVSVKQFQAGGLVGIIKEALHHNRLAPELIEIEITESIMQNFEESMNIIEELKVLGVSIAIDDFGTGYSSLSVLNNMNIDTLKIDKSFVSKLLEDMNTAFLTKTIIDMGKNIHAVVIAEGIETKEQEVFLKNCGCQIGQGFLYSKPISGEEILQQYQRLH